MAQFQVPQFIEIESKIFGPLTIKQFAYLAIGVGVVLLFYFLLPFYIFVVASVPVAAFAIALAFYKINNQPFIKIVESAVKHYTTTRLFLWKKETKTQTVPGKNAGAAGNGAKSLYTPYAPKFTGSKLRDLSWSLDVRGRER